MRQIGNPTADPISDEWYVAETLSQKKQRRRDTPVIDVITLSGNCA